MPTQRPLGRVHGRHIAALATAALALITVGCPPTGGTSGTGVGGVPAISGSGGTGTIATAAPGPAPSQPSIVITPAPGSGGGHNASPPPQSLFATPTPAPTPMPSPTLEPLDLQMAEGYESSNFADNLFIVPAVGDLPHLDPPSSRSYSAFNDMGIGATLASNSGFPQTYVSTQSVPADWSISQVATLDVRAPAGTGLPTALPDLIFFKLPGGATASSISGANATDTVEIDLATVSQGVLLTFTANVTASTQQSFDSSSSPSVTVQVLASNEGNLSFSISSLRQCTPDRMTP